MYSIFFDGMGNVSQIIVPHGKTVTGNFYATKCLSAVEKTDKNIWPSRDVRGCVYSMIMPGLTTLVKSKRK